MNRDRLTTGFAILAVLGVASVIGLVFLLNKWRPTQSQLSQRAPVLELTYCNSNNTKPCIVSFGIDPDGNMLVNLFVPASFSQDFYLKIVRNNNETRYECQMVEDFPTSFYCVGEKLPPGSVLQFMLVSSKDDILLAKGEISILGLAFPTLGIPLPTSVVLVPGTPGQGLLTETPIPFRLTPGRATPTRPSYPNPSPSYP